MAKQTITVIKRRTKTRTKVQSSSSKKSSGACPTCGRKM